MIRLPADLAGDAGNDALESIDQLTQKAKDKAQTEWPAADTHGVNEEVDEKPIDDAVGKEDAEAAPLVTIMHV
jgi:hypothetical protein